MVTAAGGSFLLRLTDSLQPQRGEEPDEKQQLDW